MWETLSAWFVENLTDIMVPVVGVIIVAVLFGPFKILARMKSGAGETQGPDAKLAMELGVTESALRNFFKILEEEHTSPDELDAKLRDIAARHVELLARVAAIPDSGENTDALRDEAQVAIKDGRYDDADDILRRAEDLDVQDTARLEDELHARHMAAAASAMARGELARTRFKYPDASGHFLRAAERYPEGAVRERVDALSWAGLAYLDSAAYTEAEAVFIRARTLAEAELGQNDPLTATVLNNLAQLYKATGRYEEAEPLMRRALNIGEAALGPDHPDVAIRLSNLAALYHAMDRFDEAEPLMVRSLSIDEAAYGPDHPSVARDLNNLASLYKASGRPKEAEPLMERAVGIATRHLGAEHPHTKTASQNLAILHAEMNAGG